MDKRQKSSKAKPKKPNRPRRPGNEVAFWDAEREDITSGRQSGKKSLPRVLKKRGKANSKKTAVSDQREIASGDTVGKKAFWRSLASRAYIAGAIIVVTAALVWAFTAFFTVGEINVYGNSKHTKEEIIELSGVDYGDSLLLLSKSKIKNGIVGDSLYIEDVTVRRLFPDTVEITVTDKTVAYAFEANGAYWLASGTGTLLDLTLSRPAGSVEIVGAKLEDSERGNTFSCEDDAKQIILKKLFAAISDYELGERLNRIDITETYCVVLTCDGAFDIILGSAENIASDCSKISAVVEKAKLEGKTSGCFDMRDGSIRYTSQRWERNILN